MFFSKKIVIFLLIALIVQPLIYLTIHHANHEATEHFIDLVSQANNIEFMDVSIKVLKEGTGPLLEKYGVSNIDDLVRLREKTIHEYEFKFSDKAKSTLSRFSFWLIIVEFILSIFASLLLVYLFAKSMMRKTPRVLQTP
ncbi:hypothetical protein QN372_19685 [Undibacterium sp. RTI2.1]|uniref:hypothetical protein n=1 Tax=unclassified Undibacterium TaxID=2630295 RepID=UPI002B222C1D|nr:MULTISPECIES: hypothetical protein [unclassified Undibacterium]MEB0032974.1 hypothetical protein [Undibacterium sp. RTI2.1]MEB0118853.1 hypothetical protein [Undibacterium sp. RTI2.2]